MDVIRDICKECGHNNTTDYVDCTLCNGGSHFVLNEKYDCKNCKHSEESIYECMNCINHSDFKSKEDNYMSESNNRKDKMKELEEYLNKAYELLDELKEEEKIKEASKENILKEYRTFMSNEGRTFYYINEFNDIEEGKVYNETNSPCLEDINKCTNYPTKELAEQSLKLKSFNDKLLAFKYCYDRDYVPDWKDGAEKKYYIFMHCEYRDNYFDYDCAVNYKHGTVFFSSEEIAEKCCDWLNNELKEGEIII